jgi:signal transduction histidine kinase
MFGVTQDITERKQVEQELEQTKVRLEVLSRQLLETSEAELRRIARELHDEIGQTLTAAKLEIEAARRLHDPAAIGLRLDDSLALIEHLLQSVRELSLNLRPASLDALGLVGAIQAHATAMAGRVGLKLSFEADELKARFDSSMEIACFRVAQEALTNVLRHAHATSVRIALRRSEGDFLRLEVEDNGFGFDPAAAMSSSESGVSFGLLGMRERAELTGGSFSCLATPGQGTEIIAFFPMRSVSS